ncbi:MAG: hypothetical protein R3C26_11810 [Calditrichia bacterium]
MKRRRNRFTVNQGFPWFGTLRQQRKIAEREANRGWHDTNAQTRFVLYQHRILNMH